jgi:AcrR family transcriptional regulator
MARPRQVSDEEIIEAARACILEFGPGVSTAKIAERVDVSAQALLKRFGGKDNLVLAALRPLVRPEWAAHLPDGDDERALVEQLRDVAEVGSEFFHELVHAILAMKWSVASASQALKDHQNPPMMVVQTIAAWLESLHERGLIRCVDFQACALAFLGSLQVRGILENALGEAPIAETHREYVDTIARMYASILAPDDGA